MALTKEECAKRLLEIAAGYSVHSQFGWASPYCEALTEAARHLRGEPEKVTDPNKVEAVLS